MDLRGRIGALLGTSRRWHAIDFYSAAEQVKAVPSGELAVAEACLSDGGPVAERAIRQLREARSVYRLREPAGSYELRVVSTDHLLIRGTPRSGWSTPSLDLDTTDGRRLELAVTIQRAGFVGLSGQAVDGARWPRLWNATPATLASILDRAPWIDLPTPTAIRLECERARAMLRDYLTDPSALPLRLFSISADPPATDEAIETFEAQSAFTLPPAYAELLRRANGVEIPMRVVLGTRDAYRLDLPGPKRLVISPPDEDGAVVLLESGAVEFVTIDSPDGAGRPVAGDFRSWLAQEIRKD